MEFGLSEDQSILEDAVRRALEDRVPLDRVREIAKTGTGYDEEIWKTLTDLGVIGILVPSQFGGSGLHQFDAAIVEEALGRHVVPAPYLPTAIMAPTALLESGTDAQKEEWLPKIAAGAVRFGCAVSEATGARADTAVSTRNGRLEGKAIFALDGASADAFLVAADDASLAIVPRDAAGLTITPMTTIDRTRSVSELRLEGVEADFLGGAGGAGRGIARMIDAGRTALAADNLGAAQRMIEKAVDYAKGREQFDRVIASFQAVKHMCAEMVAALEPSRALVWYAAHAQDFVPEEASLVACHAKAHLAEVSTGIAKVATQVHGGMGFTDLLGLHYWFKRIGFNRQFLGGPNAVREEAARLQGFVSDAA